MKREKREKQLEAGFDYKGFDYNGIWYRVHTVQDLLTLRRVDSPYYESKTDGDWIEGVLDYCFVSSQSDEVINEAKESPEVWRETVDEYAKNFRERDLMALLKLVAIAKQHETNANVEVLEDGEKK